jgi:hypothetical protein
MSTYFFLSFFYLFLLLNKTEGGKINEYSSKNSPDDQLVQQHVKSTKDDSPTFHGPKNDLLERELHDAVQDEKLTFHSPRLDLLKNQLKKKPTRSFKAIFETATDDLLEQELEEATKDDAYVPTSLDNSFLKESSDDSNDFEDVKLSMSPLSIGDNQQLKYFSLDKVLPGHLPPGIIRQNYSFGNRIKLIELYRNNNIENTKELFEFLVQNIHHKYTNCVTNLGQWLRNPHSDEPIFYRNCVPCTNAVDLNLQSLFNNYIHTEKLEHYFVNTCEMGKQWISYISDMEYLSIDFKRHPTTTFTDVIRQNLLPNHRLFNGIHLKSILLNQIEQIIRKVFFMFVI